MRDMQVPPIATQIATERPSLSTSMVTDDVRKIPGKLAQAGGCLRKFLRAVLSVLP